MKVEKNGIYDEDEVVNYIQWSLQEYHGLGMNRMAIIKLLACELDYMKLKGIYGEEVDE